METSNITYLIMYFWLQMQEHNLFIFFFNENHLLKCNNITACICPRFSEEKNFPAAVISQSLSLPVTALVFL